MARAAQRRDLSGSADARTAGRGAGMSALREGSGARSAGGHVRRARRTTGASPAAVRSARGGLVGPEAVGGVARAQARLVGATPEEVDAAARAALAALAHPLLRRAAAAVDCRREEPVVHRLEDGTLLEGVVDLAFREGGEWVIVDFKTDARPDSHPQYAAQLQLYCRAITAATGLPARAALLGAARVGREIAT